MFDYIDQLDSVFNDARRAESMPYTAGDPYNERPCYNHTRHPQDSAKCYPGLALSIDDPRAWTNTLAFYNRTPTQAEVDSHLAKCSDMGISVWGGERIPVLYDFGEEHRKHYPDDTGIRWDMKRDLMNPDGTPLYPAE